MVYLFKLPVAGLFVLYDILVACRRRHKGKQYTPTWEKHILTGFGIGTLLFVGAAVWGSTYAAHHFIVRQVAIRTPHKAFKEHPLRIALLSDLHLGTWRNPHTVQQIVHLVNEQHADMVLFTGDMVQSSSKEMRPYLDLLATIKAPLGVFAVLGNHDYGTYSDFKSDEAREADMAQWERYIQQMEWQLLRNENIRLAWHGDSVTVAGIDFWCDEPTKINTGDIEKTFRHVNRNDYVVLLSHNPEIWDRLLQTPWPADLTLCGHTHGMQAGLLTPHLRCSPAALAYRQWGGLYSNGAHGEKTQHLYVNPGLASSGMPARFGIYPEITLITLE